MATSVTEKPPLAQPIQHWKCARDASDLILGVEKLRQLQPYIFHCLRQDPNTSSFPLDELKLIILTDKQAVFTANEATQREHPRMIESVQTVCRNYFYNPIYVSPKGDKAHHRPLEAHIIDPHHNPEKPFDHHYADLIYFTNSDKTLPFDQVLEELKRLYPDAVRNVPPQEPKAKDQSTSAGNELKKQE